MIPQESQKITLILCWETLRLIANQNNGWWQACYLRCIVDLGSLELIQGRFMPFDRGLYQTIQLTCRDALIGLLKEHLRVVQ